MTEIFVGEFKENEVIHTTVEYRNAISGAISQHPHYKELRFKLKEITTADNYLRKVDIFIVEN